MNVLHIQRTWQDGNGTTFSRSASSDKIFQGLAPEQQREIEQYFQRNPPADGYHKYTVPLPRNRVFSCNIQAMGPGPGLNGLPIVQRTCKLDKVRVG